jgi:hypothetical protein
MRESQSTPAIKLDNGDDLVDPSGKLGDNSLQSGAKTAQIKMKRNANSLPRMGGTSYTARRMGSKGRNEGLLSTKNTFGIIPTLTTEMKQSHRNDYIKRLKQMRSKDEDADRFLNNNKKGIEESPTSMKMKNTFILVNNNPSFDNYAAMMKKRKLG